MKKLLAILLICALYAPYIARFAMYTECTLQVANTQQCDCNLSSTPIDEHTAFPEKQKEIQQQTDWKYLLAEKPALGIALIDKSKRHSGCLRSMYSFIFINSVFHPPGISNAIA